MMSCFCFVGFFKGGKDRNSYKGDGKLILYSTSRKKILV